MQWTLLQKYLSEECTPAEKARVEDWLQQDPENEARLASLKRIWEVTPKDEMEVDPQGDWDQFKERVFDKATESAPAFNKSPSRQYHQRSNRRFFYWAAAASLLLLAGLAYLYNPRKVDKRNQPKVVMEQLVTQKGEQATYVLSDGTRIYLNAATKIEIPSNYARESRKIYLRYGEAYFQVTHNPDNPFVVYSQDAFTKVLGTKFMVSAYPESHGIQVVVEEGKVALGIKDSTMTEKVILVKNQMGMLTQDGQAEVSSINNIDQYLGWKSGKLIFSNTPFSMVQKRLERWYDVRCTVHGGPIVGQTLTATFHDEMLREVLNVIALSLDIRYKKEGNTIIFYSQ